MKTSSLIYRFILELFDDPSINTEQFIDNGDFNISAVMSHPLLSLNLRFGFVWSSVYDGAWPTKMDFKHFLDKISHVATPDFKTICSNITLLQVIPFDVNALLSKYNSINFEDPKTIRTKVLEKWHHRFSPGFPHPTMLATDDRPLIYIFAKYVLPTPDEEVKAIDSLTQKPYKLPSGNIDPHPKFCITPTNIKEAQQFLIHKDLYFIRRIASSGTVCRSQLPLIHNNVIVAAEEATGQSPVFIEEADNPLWALYPKIAKFSIGPVNLGGIHIVDPLKIPLPRFIPDYDKTFFTALFKTSRELPFIEFVAAYLNKRQARCHQIAVAASAITKINDKPYVAVILDNRKNPMTAASVFMAALNLPMDQWDFCLYTSSDAEEYYKSVLGNFCKIIVYEPLNVRKFNIDVINTIFTSVDFWRTIEKYKKVLTIQDDGVLLRPGIESFLEWDYIGAPWIESPENDYIRQNVNSNMVGNGGFSLRTVSAMIEICQKYESEKRHLFFHNLVRIPEDVYFVRAMCLRENAEKYRVAPKQVAKLFSTEQIMCLESIGMHKAWAYNSPQSMQQFFSAAL